MYVKPKPIYVNVNKLFVHCFISGLIIYPTLVMVLIKKTKMIQKKCVPIKKYWVKFGFQSNRHQKNKDNILFNNLNE